MQITVERVQHELEGFEIDEVHCGYNSDAEPCEVIIRTQDGTTIKIKGAGNQPLVFEMETP